MGHIADLPFQTRAARAITLGAALGVIVSADLVTDFPTAQTNVAAKNNLLHITDRLPFGDLNAALLVAQGEGAAFTTGTTVASVLAVLPTVQSGGRFYS